MRRRRLLSASASGLILLPLGTRGLAQQTPKLPRIGWLWQGRSAGMPQEVMGFRQGLRDFGYVEGQNALVNYQFAEGRVDHINALVGELLQWRPDVLVGVGLPVMRGLMTTAIPVVSMSADPVGAGFVASLPRPGGHVTGISLMQGAEGLTGKRIDLLKEALPSASLIGMMYNPDFSVAADSIDQAQDVLRRRGLILLPLPVRQPEDFESTFRIVKTERVDALNVEPNAPLISYQVELGQMLLHHRVPAVSELRLLIESGGLLSYGPNIFKSARRLAYFVDRILKGSRPADLPVEQASKLELVINAKTANLLSIQLPASLLARADEVIE